MAQARCITTKYEPLVLEADEIWLSSGGEQTMPHAPVGVDLPGCPDDFRDGHVCVMCVHEPHGDAGVPGKGPVHLQPKQDTDKSSSGGCPTMHNWGKIS